MTPDSYLKPTEITELTDKQRKSAQARVLRAMNIEHRVRPDGTIAILRAHINKVFGANPDTVRKANKTVSPNWEAI